MCTVMLVRSERWVSLLLLQCYGVFLFFEYCLSFGGIFVFLPLICRRCFVCIYRLLPSSLVLFILSVLGSGSFSGGPGHIFFPRGAHRCVECRFGTIYLNASLGWVAGLYRFSLSWALLRWVRYD